MTIIKTYIGKILTLTAGTLSLGVVLLASTPKVNADTWWYPVSMRPSQNSENRHIAAMPAAASGVASASGAPGISAATVTAVGTGPVLPAQLAPAEFPMKSAPEVAPPGLK